MRFLNNVKISRKLPFIMVLLTFINASVTGGIGAYMSYNAQLNMAEESTEAMLEDTQKRVDTYLATIVDDLETISRASSTSQALKDFRAAWDEMAAGQTAALQKAYITDNPNPTGKKDELNAAADGSKYSLLHAKYHPFMHYFQKSGNYYDIFLIAPDGNLVYTVFKELDFATNLVSGQWKDTDLGALFREVREAARAGKKDTIVFKDFKPYSPSADAPASFIGKPVFDEYGVFVGVLAFQMPISELNKNLQPDDELGDDVEIHLIGQDQLLRNNPNGTDLGMVLKDKLETPDAALALKGESGFVRFKDEKGYDVLGIYEPLTFQGVHYGLTMHYPLSAIRGGIVSSQLQVLLWTLVTLAFITVLSIMLSRSITNPLTNLANVMGDLANGNNRVDVPYREQGDEIGGMARTVEVFKENALKVDAMTTEQKRLEEDAKAEKTMAMRSLADSFDARVGGVIRLLSQAAQNMTNTAQQMKGASDQNAQISGIVAAAATQADSNVQTVAAAAEELAASSSEIARQIDSVAKKASMAASDAQVTRESVHELNVLADSIGEVIGTIKDIADQTNLLALNATIEAARAGEAGKGFAVVADEVKKLANETAQKTEEIDQRVARIQEAIRNSVQAMEKIIDNVGQIDAATTSVAGAVEEQNAATGEIGRNVTEASTGTQQVSSSIVQVQHNAAQTGDSANVVLAAASELKDQADLLQSEVSNFLQEIRNA